MMKKNCKKMIRHTLAGFAVLIGLLAGGLNPAFASSEIQELVYDVNGEAVDLNAEYYLEPAFLNVPQRIVAEQWSDSKWAKLGPESDAITVKLKPVKGYEPSGGFPSYGVIFGQKNATVGVELETNVMITTNHYTVGVGKPLPYTRTGPAYLNAKSNGVQLRSTWQESPSTWRAQNTTVQDSQGNYIKSYISFKERNSGKYLLPKNAGEWLHVNHPSQFGENQWKLIKK
ncbi:hypothetical protein [Bacillus cereus]|uniref:Group-specific protein n=1 Tax=Bacillus cereus TaxID=1396 RepID=A0A2A8ZTL5_BACCE|nr:hypothetical protein [Bacillus cereus]PFE08358.1 hypothetical protein CN307_28800 [Bacillus cereus]